MSDGDMDQATRPVAARRGFFAFVREATARFRESGFRGIWKAYGWKLFAAFVLFYLVRDVTLYIVLPYLAAQGIWSLWK
jgi:hypothetical protein